MVINELTWRKASYGGSNGGGCIEVASGKLPVSAAVRDSKDQSGPRLAFTPDMWRRFAQGVKQDS